MAAWQQKNGGLIGTWHWQFGSWTLFNSYWQLPACLIFIQNSKLKLMNIKWQPWVMGQMGPTLCGCIILTGYCMFIERCANEKGVTKITHPNNTWNHFLEIPIAVLLTTYDTWDDPPNALLQSTGICSSSWRLPKVPVSGFLGGGGGGGGVSWHWLPSWELTYQPGSWEDDFVLFQ